MGFKRKCQWYQTCSVKKRHTKPTTVKSKLRKAVEMKGMRMDTDTAYDMRPAKRVPDFSNINIRGFALDATNKLEQRQVAYQVPGGGELYATIGTREASAAADPPAVQPPAAAAVVAPEPHDTGTLDALPPPTTPPIPTPNQDNLRQLLAQTRTAQRASKAAHDARELEAARQFHQSATAFVTAEVAANAGQRQADVAARLIRPDVPPEPLSVQVQTKRLVDGDDDEKLNAPANRNERVTPTTPWKAREPRSVGTDDTAATDGAQGEDGDDPQPLKFNAARGITFVTGSPPAASGVGNGVAVTDDVQQTPVGSAVKAARGLSPGRDRPSGGATAADEKTPVPPATTYEASEASLARRERMRASMKKREAEWQSKERFTHIAGDDGLPDLQLAKLQTRATIEGGDFLARVRASQAKGGGSPLVDSVTPPPLVTTHVAPTATADSALDSNYENDTFERYDEEQVKQELASQAADKADEDRKLYDEKWGVYNSAYTKYSRKYDRWKSRRAKAISAANGILPQGWNAANPKPVEPKSPDEL